MSETSDMIRKTFAEGDDKRDAGLTTPEGIERFDDIVYGTDEKWQVLDVYRPKAMKGKKLPVIVSVHGGGWVYGDKERYQYYCMDLAMRGFAVVNFTYRLAPEYKFPAPLEDTNLVFAWVLENAEKYGLDTEHIFAVGDSAGAHCLGLYVSVCTNADYAAEYEFHVPEGLKLTAIALNCGAYLVQTDGNSLDEKLMADFLAKGDEKEWWMINVVNHITENYPPTFFMTSVEDFLREQAPILVEKLNSCEVPFVYRKYGDKNTRLGHVFQLDIRKEEAKRCNDEECAFFQRFC